MGCCRQGRAAAPLCPLPRGTLAAARAHSQPQRLLFKNLSNFLVCAPSCFPPSHGLRLFVRGCHQVAKKKGTLGRGEASHCKTSNMFSCNLYFKRAGWTRASVGHGPLECLPVPGQALGALSSQVPRENTASLPPQAVPRVTRTAEVAEQEEEGAWSPLAHGLRTPLGETRPRGQVPQSGAGEQPGPPSPRMGLVSASAAG